MQLFWQIRMMVAQGIQDISKLNIINMSFWDTYMSLGGSGCTLGLVIAILLLSKRITVQLQSWKQHLQYLKLMNL